LYRSTVIWKRSFLLLSARPRFGNGPSYYCLYSTEIRKRSFLLLFILDRDSGAVLPVAVYIRPRFGNGPSYYCLYSTEIRKRSFLLLFMLDRDSGAVLPTIIEESNIYKRLGTLGGPEVWPVNSYI